MGTSELPIQSRPLMAIDRTPRTLPNRSNI
jgi:hypothetical protein